MPSYVHHSSQLAVVSVKKKEKDFPINIWELLLSFLLFACFCFQFPINKHLIEAFRAASIFCYSFRNQGDRMTK